MNKNPTIVFLSFSGFYPDRDGKRQRTKAIVEVLTKKFMVEYVILGNQIEFKNSINGPPINNLQIRHIPIEFGWIDSFKKKLGFNFFKQSKVQKKIKELVELTSAKFIFSRYLHPAIYFDSRIPLIIDLDDDPDELYRTKIQFLDSWFLKMRVRFFWLLNAPIRRRLLKQADFVFVTKIENKPFYKHYLLPNLPFQLLTQVSFDEITFSTSKIEFEILFIGKLSYEPNRLGLIWFLNKVWPKLLSSAIPWHLTIISSVQINDPTLSNLISDDISISFFYDVQNINTYYQKASIVIAPIFFGGGSNIKVIEALFHKRPVVCTRFASRGFEYLIDSGNLVIADSTQSFVDAILKLGSLRNDNKEKIQNSFDNNFFRSIKNEWDNTLMSSLSHFG